MDLSFVVISYNRIRIRTSVIVIVCDEHTQAALTLIDRGLFVLDPDEPDECPHAAPRERPTNLIRTKTKHHSSDLI